VKVNLQTIGCRLNFSEIDSYARHLRAAGHVIVADPEEADIVLVNTCSVTAKAASDSRQRIRQAARNGSSRVIVTGCWSTLEPQKASRLPGVRHVIPNQQKDNLLEVVAQKDPALFDIEPIARFPLRGMRLRTRAFIKVQDGCDNRCTFCVTTLARGQGRSKPAAEVVAEIRQLLEQGVKEVVLTGVHLGSWGRDLTHARSLKDLLAQILDETDPARLRLSSLEPWDIEPDFFQLWKDPRLCPHLHLPLQSGCGDILRRMARKVTPQSFQKLVDAAREAIPDISISTDVIVGFPGEEEEFFNQSVEFIRQIGFADGHVFAFSPRPGTAAAGMSGRVPPTIIKQRSRRMRQVFKAAKQTFAQQFLGNIVNVLWEASPTLDNSGWTLSGYSQHKLRVRAHSPQRLWNHISQVEIKTQRKGVLEGEIVQIDSQAPAV
jgi:threonylcarbamoyladenosine tRNA methylthiotransferase MtaB